MEKQLFNLFMFVVVLFVIYYVFSYMNNVSYKKNKEGFTTETTTETTTESASVNIGSSQNGVAGNAANYSATIKNMAIMSKDKLLITKYRSDYENIVLNYDDYVNALMLEKILDGTTDQMKKLGDIATLNQSKAALNSIMKFVDSQ
jgi:hypothetical protein